MARQTKQLLITDICRLDPTANGKALKRKKLAELVQMAAELERLNEPVRIKKQLDLLPIAQITPPPVATFASPLPPASRNSWIGNAACSLTLALVAMVRAPLSMISW